MRCDPCLTRSGLIEVESACGRAPRHISVAAILSQKTNAERARYAQVHAGFRSVLMGALKAKRSDHWARV